MDKVTGNLNKNHQRQKSMVRAVVKKNPVTLVPAPARRDDLTLPAGYPFTIVPPARRDDVPLPAAYPFTLLPSRRDDIPLRAAYPFTLVPARRDDVPLPATYPKIKGSKTVTTILKPSVPLDDSDSESDQETLYNYLKMTPSGLLVRPKSPECVQYIRTQVVAKTAELLSQFSFDDYATPYEFIKAKLPRLKDSMVQYDMDMMVKVFYLSLDRNSFIVGVQHLFLDSKSGGRNKFWVGEGAHDFEVLATIIFFLAADLDPENLVEILSENPWKGTKQFYKFLLKERTKRNGGPLMKLARKEFSSEFVKDHISPNLKATRHIVRKIVYPPKQKTTIQLPASLQG